MQNFRLKLAVNSAFPKLVYLVLLISTLMLADSILSYATPIYAVKLFSNEFIAGIIISFSSMAGLAFDYFSKRLFGKKDFLFFIKATFLFSIMFSLSLKFSFLVSRYFLLFSMFPWGIYYETLEFSNFKYIKRLGSFDTDLIGLEQASTSLSYIIGPIVAGFIASRLSDQKVFLIFGVALGITALFALLTTPRKIKMPQTELSKSL